MAAWIWWWGRIQASISSGKRRWNFRVSGLDSKPIPPRWERNSSPEISMATVSWISPSATLTWRAAQFPCCWETAMGHSCCMPTIHSTCSLGPVAAADFNGDGKLDLAVLDFNNSSASLSILLGKRRRDLPDKSGLSRGSFPVCDHYGRLQRRWPRGYCSHGQALREFRMPHDRCRERFSWKWRRHISKLPGFCDSGGARNPSFPGSLCKLVHPWAARGSLPRIPAPARSLFFPRFPPQ